MPNIGLLGFGDDRAVLRRRGPGSTGRAQAAATVAENAGIHIDTVGVGTAAGTTIKVDGYQVHTALDEDTLTAIAQTTGGSYHPASDATNSTASPRRSTCG